MTISSQNSSPEPRAPQRARGRARVAALLAAAGEVFAARGFDAATMTEIAARAGASIGSLYQFFPTKMLLAEALVGDYADALGERLVAVEMVADQLDPAALGRRLALLLAQFRAEHPAFLALAATPAAASQRGGALRARLRHQVAAILQRRAPALPDARIQAMAVAVLQLMKAAADLQTEPGLDAKDAALGEIEEMLRHYLALHLRVVTGGSVQL